MTLQDHQRTATAMLQRLAFLRNVATGY